MDQYIKILEINEKKDLGKIDLEIDLQNWVSKKYNFCPKINSIKYNKNSVVITMNKIDGETLYEKYSDDPKKIPLFYEEGIEYVDISPYNFIIKNNKVYIIDFGDAYWCNKDCKITNWFLYDFIIDGYNGYNPDFK